MKTADIGQRLNLPNRHAHLWWVRPDVFTEPEELTRYRELLPEEERQKIDRYRFSRDRHSGLITRVLARVTLSRYCDVAPNRWRFRANAHGRPEIAGPTSSLRFNLSHTAGLIVCLVSRSRAVGVDVENLNRHHRWLDLAERFFAPTESAELKAVAGPDRPARFLEYWTLKEAYIKARGLGLAIPLNGFWFDVSGGHQGDLRVRFSETVDDDPLRWAFTLERFGGNYLIATAVGHPPNETVRVSCYEATGPLVS